jgi:outer membrane protein TolC
VAEAERTLAANTSLTAVAISELYPKITLSALFGWQNTSLLPGANLWSLASGIAMPLLNFGRIEGGIDAANARQQQAYHAYRKAVISAVADVETKLSDYAKDKEYTDSIKAVLESNRTALTLARLRYEKGLASLIDTLDAENKVYSAENELLTAQASEMRAVAALQKAGGL